MTTKWLCLVPVMLVLGCKTTGGKVIQPEPHYHGVHGDQNEVRTLVSRDGLVWPSTGKVQSELQWPVDMAFVGGGLTSVRAYFDRSIQGNQRLVIQQGLGNEWGQGLPLVNEITPSPSDHPLLAPLNQDRVLVLWRDPADHIRYGVFHAQEGLSELQYHPRTGDQGPKLSKNQGVELLRLGDEIWLIQQDQVLRAQLSANNELQWQPEFEPLPWPYMTPNEPDPIAEPTLSWREQGIDRFGWPHYKSWNNQLFAATCVHSQLSGHQQSDWPMLIAAQTYVLYRTEDGQTWQEVGRYLDRRFTYDFTSHGRCTLNLVVGDKGAYMSVGRLSAGGSFAHLSHGLWIGPFDPMANDQRTAQVQTLPETWSSNPALFFAGEQ